MTMVTRGTGLRFELIERPQVEVRGTKAEVKSEGNEEHEGRKH